MKLKMINGRYALREDSEWRKYPVQAAGRLNKIIMRQG